MHCKDNKKNKKKLLIFPAKNDWLVSHFILDMSVKAILKKVKVNRNYDIPYVAGYSQNGKIIYIDRHMPKIFHYKKRKIHTDKFLILHEAIEKTLIDRFGLHYQLAHQLALREEQAAVRAAEIEWKAYDQFMQQYIKEISDEKLKRVPKNLDMRPYRDEHDKELMEHMRLYERKYQKK